MVIEQVNQSNIKIKSKFYLYYIFVGQSKLRKAIIKIIDQNKPGKKDHNAITKRKLAKTTIEVSLSKILNLSVDKVKNRIKREKLYVAKGSDFNNNEEEKSTIIEAKKMSSYNSNTLFNFRK